MVAAKKEERTPESELPRAVQDSHRVIRTILGPNHQHINVSHCFEAIRLYSSLIMQWKEVCEPNQSLLESGSSKPTLEEEKLKMLEGALRPKSIEPPSHIEVNETTVETKSSKSRKKKHVATQSPPDNSPGTQQNAGAQLDVAGLKHEEAAPATSVPQSPEELSIPDERQRAQQAVREKVQKSAAATQVQAKTRTRLLSKLKRIKLAKKPTSKHRMSGNDALGSAMSSADDSRHPKKRRALWKKYLGIKEDSVSEF